MRFERLLGNIQCDYVILCSSGERNTTLKKMSRHLRT